MNRLISPLSAVLLCLVAWACTDDRFDNPNPEIGEGEAVISAEAAFKTYTPALDSRTPGGALNGIENLYLIVYKSTGELHSTQKVDFTPGTNTDKPSDSEGVDQPVSTGKATFSLKLPYGRYRIYAAANIRDTQAATILDPQAIATEAGLKAIRFDWDAANIAANDQMFGYFQLGSDASQLPSGNAGNNFQAPDLTINAPKVSLTAWLRRLASKVTVGYDPTGLNEGVTIYIKSVTVHDIAASCALGENNKPASRDELIANGAAKSYVEQGKDANNRDNWLKIQKGTPGGPVFGTTHSSGDDALFFYENNQGDFSDEPNKELYNKVMDKNEMDNNEFYPDHTKPGGSEQYIDWKDKVKYGTYIEVEAYYVSQNKERPSSGPIRYRFMLGKNITYDYNVQRNYHFKLTLAFKGWANEPDWHIDYDEPTPGIFTPEEYFISYLYDQTMRMPVRLTNTKGVARLRAEIIENNWAPYDPATGGVPAQAQIGDNFAWNLNAYNFLRKKYNDESYKGNANFLGFLSMRKTTTNIIGSETTNYGEPAMVELIDYYVDEKRYYAEYDLTSEGEKNIESNGTYGSYGVKKDGDGVIVEVPMWTRAKQMIPMSAFTGNNPYNAYRRKAVVRFTAYNENNDVVSFKDKDEQGNEISIAYKDVPIYQVRRIENPKAIWRSADNDASFDIDLSILPDQTSSKFVSLPSSGAWRASIMVDNGNFITISKDGRTVSRVNTDNGDDKYIGGSTGSYMRFTYKPAGKISEGSSRSGIIKVEYQDYSCVHYIFVRQGYDGPTALGGRKWSSYNVYAMKGSDAQPQNRKNAATMNVMVTESPLSVGSFFKRADYRYGIMEENNISYGAYKSITGVDLKTVKLGANNDVVNEKAKWDAIEAYGWTSYNGSAPRIGKDYSWAETMKVINQSNATMKVPTYADFEALAKCRQGYGVVYGDGATVTAKSTTDAYGFRDLSNNNNGYSNGNGGSKSGSRACLIYDETNGNQIIFPIGVIGQGRRARTVWDFTTGKSMADCQGMLSYSGVYGVLPGEKNYYRPIPYNLYRDPGALYWFEIPCEGGHYSDGDDSASWDINYFSFTFGPYSSASLGDGSSKYDTPEAIANSSDALPIRLIYK